MPTLSSSQSNGIPRLRLGTRSSPLALWQAEWVAARLHDAGVDVELVHITTQGDVLQQPLTTAGGDGLFTKEIQRALLDNRADIAVHSLKDLPTQDTPELALAAVPHRETVADVLVSKDGLNLDRLPLNARIGTGSRRRQAQLKHYRSDLLMADIRGNVETRLHKLVSGEYDAIVLAKAGLVRLGLAARITHDIPRSIMLPAVGQGALGIEVRACDEQAKRILAELDDPETHTSVLAERALLRALRAGCMAPVGAWGRVVAGKLTLSACVLSPDGRHRISVELHGDSANAEELGEQAAAALSEMGAARLISAAHA